MKWFKNEKNETKLEFLLDIVSVNFNQTVNVKQPVSSYGGLKLRFLSYSHAYSEKTMSLVEALHYNLL